ncbi:MAG TPA: hypothetical protein VGJ84_04690 [Polyangiaceae bacterium]
MLDAFQDLLAELATRRALRAEFRRDPASVLSSRDLDARERTALAALPAAALERYAASLVAKRWTDVRRIVPSTLRVYPRFRERYRAWALEHPAPLTDSVLPPGPKEALRALDPLRSEILRDPSLAPYTADLLAYEVLAACARSDGVLRTMSSLYPMHEIVRELRGPCIPIDPEPKKTLIRFSRTGARWKAV